MGSEERGNWSIAQAAARIGVSRHTLRSWLRLRRLPYIRAGRRILLAPEDVESFLQSHRVEARDEQQERRQ
jgi:excisionase family DNA binding protein